MEEITSYSFSVEISKNEDGTFAYGVFQDFDGENLQLLETGGADTLSEAASQAASSIKTLFVV